MRCGQESIMQLWWCHQLLSMEPWAASKNALCKFGGATSSCSWSHGPRPKKLYASAVVPPALVHGAMRCGQESIMQLWWCHQLLSMEPWAASKHALCKFGGATSSYPWSHGPRPKMLYASLVVPPAPVHGAMGRGQKSFMLVWWCHQPLSMEPWPAAKKTFMQLWWCHQLLSVEP